MAIEAVPDSISFEQAIALSQSLLEQMEQGSLTAAEVEQTIQSLVHSENGARGFFVAYLSGNSTLAEQPGEEVLRAVRSAPDIVSSLLVKNLVMSTAMAIAHRRNQQEEMAQGSDRVQRRTATLIQGLQLPQIQTQAAQLKSSIDTGTGTYQPFLDRWGYDQEQRQAMRSILEQNRLV